MTAPATGREARAPAAGPEDLEALDGERFDAVVLGGGILGAGLAREFARRGLRCLLVERRDFGWGTTARSTRLIHGGLRYLATYDFGLVREGLRERAWLLRAAPNLVTPLPFLLPFHATPLWQRLRLRAGLTLYDLLSPRSSLPRHRMLSASTALALEPGLEPGRLVGAAMYWDAQVELPERLVIEALRAARDAGAEIRNHVAAAELRLRGGRIRSLALTRGDGLIDTPGKSLGEHEAVVETSRVVNATGPWADETLRTLGVRRDPLLRLTQGSHLVYSRLAEHAVAFEHPDDGRLCFAIPWQGQTMVGTTERDLPGRPADAAIQPEEVRYLVRAARFCLPKARGRDPEWGTVGIRSLIQRAGKPSTVPRRHVVIDHEEDGVGGLVTVAGGKLTAWRSISAGVVDEILGRRRPVASDGPWLGVTPPPVAAEPSDGVARRLWKLFGARAEEVRERALGDAWWREPLVPGGSALRAEVAYVVENEWAITLADIVLRRLALGFGPDLGRGAAVQVARVLVERLGWNDARVIAELAELDAENAERALPAT